MSGRWVLFRFFTRKFCVEVNYTFAVSTLLFALTYSSPNLNFTPAKRAVAYRDDSIKEKFDIHPNTIILTAESRSMGAKYINETEVSSNDECLLWCWRESNCNVVVFEGISGSSCFLFGCGSPADFRCKFASHDLYISSVLKTTQHSYDLKQWSKEARQEKELTAAKQLASDVSSSTAPAMTTAVAAVLKSPASTDSTSTEENLKPQSVQKCRRYQFQCVNDSECIAIYNVCDGIPQCLDGSDESVDLHCPNQGDHNSKPSPLPVKLPSSQTSPKPLVNPAVPNVEQPTQLAVLTQPPPPIVVRPDLPLPKPISHGPLQQPQHITPGNKKLPPKEMRERPVWQEGYRANPQGVDYDHSADASPSMHSPFTHKHSKFVAANEQRLQYPSHWPYDYERYPQQPASLDPQYNSYENAYSKLNEPFPKGQYPDYDKPAYDNYHSEDGPFLSDQDRVSSGNYLTNDYLQASLSPSNRQIYPNREDLYAPHRFAGENERNALYAPIDKPLMKQPVQVHESSDRENYLVPSDGNIRPQPYETYDDMPRTDYHLVSDLRPQGLNAADQRLAEEMYNRDEAIRQSLAKQLHIPPEEPVHMPKHMVLGKIPMHTTMSESTSKPTEADNSISEKTEAALPPPSEQPNHSAVETNEDGHSKLANSGQVIKFSSAELAQIQQVRRHESNNAIVALTLGLIVTAMLVALVVCRLRTLRRRTSRRGRSLAHDADYLVNGLYL